MVLFALAVLVVDGHVDITGDLPVLFTSPIS